MSRIFEALQKANAELTGAAASARQGTPEAADVLEPASSLTVDLDQCAPFTPAVNPQNRLVALNDGDSLGAEKIRVLTTRLRQLRHKRRLNRILVTSCMAGEGKSVISTNLAISLATHSRARTLLIDGDLRKPTVAKLLGLSNREDSGVAAWWKGDQQPLQLLRRAEGVPLWVLPAGQITEQPLEVLQSQRMAELLNQLSAWFEWVIIDSPPFTPLADSSVWSALSDGTLFVVRERFTSAKLLRKTIESFDANKLLGVVVNESSEAAHRYYRKYYYAYDKGAAKART